ncbi:MAG: class I SAM-dependent methyltransferase [Candidatus Rokuibacteriota bacterium]
MLREFALDAIGTVSIEETSSKDLLKLSTRTYWQRVWPAGLGLAAYVVEHFGREGLRGRRVLDLGCGVGLIGIVCGRLGAHVTFLDREAGALATVRRNCRRNGLGPAQTIGGDWNPGGRRLEPAAYDVVVGGDVVYDDAEWPAISTGLMRALRQDGIALLADPGWVTAGKLRASFRRGGFSVTRTRRRVGWPPWRVGRRRPRNIDIYMLRRRPAPAPFSRSK